METILWLLHVADLNENKLILGFYYCGIDEYVWGYYKLRTTIN